MTSRFSRFTLLTAVFMAAAFVAAFAMSTSATKPAHALGEDVSISFTGVAGWQAIDDDLTQAQADFAGDTGFPRISEHGFSQPSWNMAVFAPIDEHTRALVIHQHDGGLSNQANYTPVMWLQRDLAVTGAGNITAQVGHFTHTFGIGVDRRTYGRSGNVQNNPFVGNTFVDPSPNSIGLELMGEFDPFEWTFSVFNNESSFATDFPSFDEDRGYGYIGTAKFTAVPGVDLMGSYFHGSDNPDAGGMLNQGPLLYGLPDPGTLGAGPHTEVLSVSGEDLRHWQLDAMVDFRDAGEFNLPVELWAFYGDVESDVAGGNELSYWNFQGVLDIAPNVYLAAGYGAAETQDDNTGDRMRAGIGVDIGGGVLGKVELVDQSLDTAFADNTGTREFSGVASEISWTF